MTAIGAISQTIGEVSRIATAIVAAVEEQGAATQESPATCTRPRRARISANIAGVSRRASETGAAASQILGVAGELSKQAEHLSGKVQELVTNLKLG